MRICSGYFPMFCLVVGALVGTATAAEVPVTEKELAALVTNKTVWVKAKYGSLLQITYPKNGPYCSRGANYRYDCAKGQYDPYVGWVAPWRIHDKKLCMMRPKPKVEYCYQVVKIGNGNYRLVGVGGQLDEAILHTREPKQSAKK